jgi:prepilin-type processing-associated H-X9-DG protein
VTRNLLVKNAATRNILYCPSFEEQNIDADWNYNANRSTIGYFLMIERMNGNFPPMLDRMYQKGLKPVFDANNANMPKKPSDIEIAADPVVNDSRNKWTAQGTYIDHITPHMNRATEPEGGNILFMDGHVVWRPFGQMKARANTSNTNFYF